jgi:preprotein translocase SecE subunit
MESSTGHSSPALNGGAFWLRKDRGLATRSRAARTSPAKNRTLREEEIDPAGEPVMNEEPEFDDEEEEEVAEADNALPAAFASDQSLTSTADRTALRTYTVPTWTLGNPITRFIAESYIELRKVTWPTWREAWNWTLIVIAMSAVVALILAGADIGLSRLLTWVVGLSSGK